MFAHQSKNKYTITLPLSTAGEVMEWFEIMENNNKLADALIELVYENIKSGKASKVYSSLLDSHDEIHEAPNIQQGNQDDFIDRLYNWQDSNGAIFKEDPEVKEVRKEKKRMLSV